MSSAFQSIVALVIVAVAATWLVVRTLAKRRNPSCGGDCGCEASDLKARVRPR
jgi:hypothetical protein